jgi:peptidoglycan hydrolase FlgJ
MIPSLPSSAALRSAPPAETPAPDAALRRAAEGLEATFLSEMLKATEASSAPGEFGGGAGEAAFGSFLRDLRARDVASRGGIGLAEIIFESLKARGDAAR